MNTYQTQLEAHLTKALMSVESATCDCIAVNKEGMDFDGKKIDHNDTILKAGGCHGRNWLSARHRNRRINVFASNLQMFIASTSGLLSSASPSFQLLRRFQCLCLWHFQSGSSGLF